MVTIAPVPRTAGHDGSRAVVALHGKTAGAAADGPQKAAGDARSLHVVEVQAPSQGGN